jgi:predicted nucleotidyltransferase
MAEQSTILRALVGSTVHGLALEGTDDRDEMGVCIEPVEHVVGFSEFEQYIYRSAAEREGKHDAPSQPGDLDLTIYSLRKYLRLAMQGNPTVLTLLFTRGAANVYVDARGMQLQELAPLIISRQAGKRYLGYLESQRQRLMGERGQKKVNRPELEERFGYDTKYAMHMLRLGFQGVELLTTGALQLPMVGEPQAFCYACRKGEIPLQDVLGRVGLLERDLKDLISDGPLRDTPDQQAVESWMTGMYWEKWKGDRFHLDRRNLAGVTVVETGQPKKYRGKA